MKRKKLNQTQAKRSFSRTASKVHGKNNRGRPMRGGIRL